MIDQSFQKGSLRDFGTRPVALQRLHVVVRHSSFRATNITPRSLPTSASAAAWRKYLVTRPYLPALPRFEARIVAGDTQGR